MESKELGLVLGEKLLGFKALHYGYWKTAPKSEGEYTLLEVIQAQKEYSKFLLSHLEREIKKIRGKKILDVGCGTGEMLQELLEKKYHADALTPSKELQKTIEKNLYNIKTSYKPLIYSCTFEKIMEEPKVDKYDLIFFSESFQYIPMQDTFRILLSLLKEKGIVVVCDFFKIKHSPQYKHLVGGGHLWKDFEYIQSKIPFKKIKEIDITKQTSWTLEIISYFLQKRFYPSMQLINQYLQHRLKRSILFYKNFFYFFFKKILIELRKKYFLGYRTAKSFQENNKYMLTIFQKK